eukprot:11791598-Alexandrium_andersonii.AAC.1
MRWKLIDEGPPVPVAPKACPGKSNPTRGKRAALEAGPVVGPGSLLPSPPPAPEQHVPVEHST